MMIRLVSVAAKPMKYHTDLCWREGVGPLAVNVRSLYVAGNWNFRAQQLCDSAGDPAIRATTAIATMKPALHVLAIKHSR
jgi:hypothetical protein